MIAGHLGQGLNFSCDKSQEMSFVQGKHVCIISSKDLWKLIYVDLQFRKAAAKRSEIITI